MFSAFSQEPKTYFEYEIAKHLKAYKTKSDAAIKNDNREYAQFLFDSLFTNYLKNSYVLDMQIKMVKGGILNTSDIEHSFLLITKTAWEQINRDEIKAINKMAKMYKDQMDIVILFWTSKSVAKDRSRDYNSLINITYVNERDNNANQIIKPYKHSFGAPACFYISEEKKLVNIDRKFTLHLKNDDTGVAFETAHEQIKLILFGNDNSNEAIITTLH
ncbi:hypothetical protein SAMN04515667_2641 [Formosa sp. Hel1_31_208]|nr:hypothetical protein SAMN04515667_2641 [Formosa sp. Hel1_31_208]